MEFLDYLEENNIDYSVEDDGRIVIPGDLDLRGSQITELPEKLSVGGNLGLSETQITELPDDLSVGGDLFLRDTPITELPDGLSVGGSLYLNPQITKLPNDLSVGGNLDLRNTKITELPDNLSVGGNLELHRVQITKLPNNLKVNGHLDLRCTQITKLPDNLSVGSLEFGNTQVTELPEDLSVSESLYLDVEKITNIAYHKDCTWWRLDQPIFAAYVNKGIQIAAGWFLGTLDEFDSIVDKRLAKKGINTVDAKKYKQTARECVKELEEMRSH